MSQFSFSNSQVDQRRCATLNFTRQSGKIAVFAILWLLALPLVAQRGSSPGRAGQQTGQGQANPDTTKSVNNPKLKIRNRTELIFPERLLNHQKYAEEVEPDINKLSYFDEVDRLDGFVQNLGQIGKPYRRYTYGLPSTYFPGNQYVNPTTGAEEGYLTNLDGGVKYYDSRTPYFNAQYHQGLKKINSITGTASINYSPFVNSTFQYLRRKGNGAYSDNQTDQYNVFFSTYVHSYDSRLHIFASGVWDQLIEGIHGGTTSDQLFDDSFDKVQTDLALSGANFVRRHRAINIHPVYRVNSDSVETKHKFLVTAKFQADDFFQQYTDASYSNGLDTLPVPIYSLIDTGNVFERIINTRYTMGGGLSYGFDFGRLTGWARGGIYQHFIRHSQFRLEWWQDRTEIDYSTGVDYEGRTFDGALALEGNFEAGNLFNPSFYVKASGEATFGPKIVDYINPQDSLKKMDSADGRWYEFVSHQPLHVEATYLQRSQTPTYSQSYYRSFEYNNYHGVLNLNNTFLSHLRGSISFEGKKRKKNERDFLPKRVGAEVFLSNMDRMIWFDSTFSVRQAGPNERLTMGGIKVFFRANLGRFYLENETVFQQALSAPDTEFGNNYRNYLPWFHGKASIFYQNEKFKLLNLIRVGLQFRYQSAYDALLFEPTTQQFYAFPQANRMIPYVAIDALVTIKIKSAFIYLKLIHANECISTGGGNCLLAPGYYTTPYYPMLERTFFFGVNWTLFN